MVISFTEVVLLVIVLFGVYGVFRGVRAVALTTGAIFFGIVVVVFSAAIIVAALRRLGLPLDTVGAQDLSAVLLFVFVVLMASLSLRRIVGVRTSGLARTEKLWGFALGLLNGFLIMAVVEHYLSDAIQSGAPVGAPVQVGVPDLVFSHPVSNTWSVSLVSQPLVVLPPAATNDLWSKLPIALVLLLLFLAFVFVGILYGRLNRARGRG